MRSYGITVMHRGGGWVRWMALMVSVAFTMQILTPTVMAAQQWADEPAFALRATHFSEIPAERRAEARFASVLKHLERHLETQERALTHQAPTAADASAVDVDAVAELRRQLETLDADVLEHFTQVRIRLVDQQVPAAILARHDAMVATYRAELGRLLGLLTDLETSLDASERLQAVQAALAQLRAHPNARPPQPLDPHDLPNQTLPADPARTPKDTPAAFLQAGLRSHPPLRLAALGDFQLDGLPGAEDPAYRAATVEVTLSEAIQAKAAELNQDPIQIYNWVRNTVAWLPSWGAYQSADLTLSSQRGNALDIASLLIALLRASGIPARYVHGTIELPAERFQNWAGDFADVAAAIDFASRGGIPITSVLRGGQITHVRLEHVWVEAALDFYPSRGTVNQAADTWVALDPSFKQYTHLQGLDILHIAGLNPEHLAQSFVDSGTVNDPESWVTGFDPTILEQAQHQAQTALQQYLDEHLTDPTVGDVIGGRKTIIQASPVLPTGLPYPPRVIGARYGALPSALQHHMQIAFQRDALGDLVDPITLPWAQVNNQKLTLSFKPATAADEQTLLALLPEGEITDPAQLPSSIPAYLIRVIPELRLNGTLLKQGAALTLGEELSLLYQTAHPGVTDPPYAYKVIAGSYLNLPVIGGSVSPGRLQALQQRLEATKSTLESGDSALIASLTREDVLGDLFQAGGLGYFAQYTGLSHLLALPQRATHQLAFGYGSYGYEPTVDYFFGFPRALNVGGAVMNIRIARQLGTHQIDPVQLKSLNLQVGLLSSALEHAIPEQMFVTPENPGEAISAVKALAKANAQGQRIYHITPANQTTTLPNIHHHPETLAEIHSALAVGLEVITHTDAVSVPGWSGAGYILFDPETGSGAYKIGGGGNGGSFYLGGQFISTFLFGTLVPFLGINGFLPLLLVLISIITILHKASILIALNEFDPACFFTGVLYFAGFSTISYGLYELIKNTASKIISALILTTAILNQWSATEMPSAGDCSSQ
ncbi:MAG: hypothetical protein H6975_10100 [Gammaproteobacteria bacterium]|nr:hypothetical protein [Gammaproteobacteria bacterium]